MALFEYKGPNKREFVEELHEKLNKHFGTLIPVPKDRSQDDIIAQVIARTYIPYLNKDEFIEEISKDNNFVKALAFPKYKIEIYDILPKSKEIDKNIAKIVNAEEFLANQQHNFFETTIQDQFVGVYFLRLKYDFSKQLPIAFGNKVNSPEIAKYEKYQQEYVTPGNFKIPHLIQQNILEDKNIRRALKKLYEGYNWPIPEWYSEKDKDLICRMYNSRFKFFGNHVEAVDFAKSLNIRPDEFYKAFLKECYAAKEGFMILKSTQAPLPSFTKKEFEKYCLLLRSQFSPAMVDYEIESLKRGLNYK